MKKKKKSISGKPFDVISIGDCGMDMFMGLNTTGSRNCSVDKDQCYLMLNYADKIAADFQEYATGGNAANLAIGASRLGLKVGFYTELGDDTIGTIVQESLLVEGVAKDYVHRLKGAKTNFHVVLNHEAERTIIVYHNKRTYKLPAFKKSEWIYYTSMAEGFEKMQKALVKHVKKHKVKLGFNPGTYQLKAGYKKLKAVISVCEVFIVNTHEAERILGKKHNGNDGKPNFKKLLVELSKLGPKKVVVTDGPNGSYAFDSEEESHWHMGIYDVPVIERTGAGDATSTAVISALVQGKSLAEALRWGVFSSASVIQEIGPQMGLLKKSAMNKFLREHKEIQAQMI